MSRGASIALRGGKGPAAFHRGRQRNEWKVFAVNAGQHVHREDAKDAKKTLSDDGGARSPLRLPILSIIPFFVLNSCSFLGNPMAIPHDRAGSPVTPFVAGLRSMAFHASLSL